MPTPRSTLATAVLDGKIYAVGGHGAGGPRLEMEAYTPDGWPFPKAVFGHPPRQASDDMGRD